MQFFKGENMKKLFLILLLVAGVAHAEIYKWTDKEGTVHFSDSLAETPNSTQSVEIVPNTTAVENETALPAKSPQSPGNNGSVAPDVGDLKNRMLKDDQIMAIIREMQNDPEFQVILKDPAMMHAIEAGDISTLLNNPDFVKILNNPRIKEIENRLNYF